MSKRFALLICGALLLSGPSAFAAEPGPYVRLDTGWSLSSGAGSTVNDDLGSSYLVGAGIGYRLSSWIRTDVSVGYRGGYRVDSSSVTGLTGTSAKADVNSLVGMLGVYVDVWEFGFAAPWGKYGSVTPYVGGGVGLARNQMDNVTLNGGGATGSLTGDTDSSIAWQASAGLGIQVVKGLTVDVGYRFADLGKVKSGSGSFGGAPLAAETVKGDLKAHEFQLGLRYGF